jgi:hypothetical protein
MKNSPVPVLLLIWNLLAPFPALAELNIMARYSVPVSEELKPFADYDLSDATVWINDKYLQVSYDLPLLLTGAANHIALKGFRDSEGVYQVQDKSHGHSANCRVNPPNELNCKVFYGDLTVNETNAVERIATLYASDEAMKVGKMKMVRIFSGDPIGFVSIWMPFDR